jgi:poly-gamma-glutamate synthesis protein (capsule biosynthesis protein)
MLQMMKNEIAALRPQCDVLVVSFHMGLGHTPIKIAAYEKEISYAAIDSGADLIIGHHAHILKGIEIYKGKPIYYGLCNFATSVPGLAPKANNDPDSWVQKRMEVFGFAPDPRYPTYPFHPEAIFTIIAKCIIENKKIVRASYLPCIINTKAQPQVLKNNRRGQRMFNYMEKISKGAKLNVRFEWDGDEVLVLEK